jgi:hypothetical protein
MSKKAFFSLLTAFCVVFFLLPINKSSAQTGCTNNPTSPDAVTATVTVSQTGTYTLWSRLLAPDTSNNSVYVQIDGGCAMNIGDANTIPANNWTWVNYQDGVTTTPITVSLTAGDHTVRLIEREAGVGFDRLLFVQDSTCIPTSTGDNCAVSNTPSVTFNPTPTSINQIYTTGYQTWNGAFDSGNNNMLSSTQVTTGATGGQLQSISIYMGAATAPNNNIQVGIYTDNGSNSPGTLLTTSNTQVITPNSWNTITLPGVVINPNTKYFLTFNLDGSATQFGRNSTTTGVSRWLSGVTFGTWPASFGSQSSSASEQYAIYMTYSSGSISAPTPTIAATNPPILTNTPTPTNMPTPTPIAQTYKAGYQTWNGSFDRRNNNMLSATQVTTGASGGTLQSISIYMGSAIAPNNHIQVGIYTDNGSNSPGSLVVSSGSQVISPNSFNTIVLPARTINPNTKYFLTFNLDGSKTQFGWNSTTMGVSRWRSNVTFGTWPASFGTQSSSASQQYAIFMTYK